MINHVYEVKCDTCGMADYVHGCQNKTELKEELIARGYVIVGQFIAYLFCDESCKSKFVLEVRS